MITVAYDPYIERAIERIIPHLKGSFHLSKRAIALLLIAGDEEITTIMRERDRAALDVIQESVEAVARMYADPIPYVLATQRQGIVDRIVAQSSVQRERRLTGFGDRLGQATLNPVFGVPVLILTLLTLYLWVGVFGAQVVVDWLERVVFENGINPWVVQTVAHFLPWPAIRDLLAGEYGVITLGFRYAVAIILPIVGTFFLAFAIIEDSGYLPRLAMLIDKLFKMIGLNGRAVIPMALGFGCDTMATIVTRTLETRRERVLATLLLALAIPCSAQLGVILGVLVSHPLALLSWAIVVVGVFVFVGLISSRILPGERPSFFMELPPMRPPRLSNVLLKTYARMEWYFLEVMPVFLIASVLIWLGRLTGVFELLLAVLAPIVRALGLPEEAAVAFLFGFFRRDYGAAGLYDLQGTLSGVQLLVASVTLTLFVPCVAQFAVMLKERGWKVTLGVVAFILPFAFIVGWSLFRVLTALGITL